jgi:superfamily II DNA/RNA helicase
MLPMRLTLNLLFLLLLLLLLQVKGHDVPAPLKYWSEIAKHPKEGEQQQQQHDSDDEQQQQQPSKKRKQQLADTAAAEPSSKKHKHHKQQQHIVGLSRHLMRHLEENNWATPTPIQRQAIPALLAGRELLAVAPTGSGKTLAFVLPMLALLAEQKLQGGDAWPDAPKALLLSPTHELAAQTVRVLKQLLPGSGLRCCLLSSAPAGVVQFAKVDVLVANPLRLKILVEEGKVDLSHVSVLQVVYRCWAARVVFVGGVKFVCS